MTRIIKVYKQKNHGYLKKGLVFVYNENLYGLGIKKYRTKRW